ncbi:PD-(D/E)XK nuclease-like domain-containing protein [Nonomuraea sp. SYSU D8015]|uniref:PD-(D/E)XK nuclease-like domain-containing protein n=1 Tax=Nonomuraea sp. SYSU D8015 TaxID=2593644 RepID=UPI001CB73711|nr:PD-(D/E)XK nuclease-like domain-containing protein [Nonomuraea sp. SYSU D8015]
MTAISETAAIIDGPGVYDIPEDAYHADPVPGCSLSSSGARLIMQPGGPARYHWQQTHPQPPKKAFDLGHAAHKLVLGAGPELVRIPADEWRTKEIKEQVARARERGAVPLKPADYQTVHDMADAIRRHPIASALFDPALGEPEKTLIWQDEQAGIWRRARLDWLPRPDDGRLIVGDYKTTTDASRAAIAKSVANYGYHCQQPWYLDGVTAVGIDDDPVMVFVFQEKTAPYLIQIVELDPDDVQAGREANQRAIDIYAHCQATGIWPGYSTEIATIALPRWANTTFEEIL